MKTPIGDYAIFAPHNRFVKQWEQSQAHLGPEALSWKFERWPVGGSSPDWWPKEVLDQWPGEYALRALLPTKSPRSTEVELGVLSLTEASEHRSQPDASDSALCRDRGREGAADVDVRREAARPVRGIQLDRLCAWDLQANPHSGLSGAKGRRHRRKSA